MKEQNKMKKLMIAAAIVSAAVVSQAAAMKWETSSPTKNAANATVTTSNVGVQYYLLNDTAYTAFTTAVAGMTGDEISTYIYENYNGRAAGDGVTIGSYKSAVSKGSLTITDQATYGKDDVVNAIILYTSDDTDGVENYIGNYGTWTFEGDNNKTVSKMGNTINGTLAPASGALTISGWQAASVPEPTSGLLLLLGVAGLALRRRRA